MVAVLVMLVVQVAFLVIVMVAVLVVDVLPGRQQRPGIFQEPGGGGEDVGAYQGIFLGVKILFQGQGRLELLVNVVWGPRGRVVCASLGGVAPFLMRHSRWSAEDGWLRMG